MILPNPCLDFLEYPLVYFSSLFLNKRSLTFIFLSYQSLRSTNNFLVTLYVCEFDGDNLWSLIQKEVIRHLMFFLTSL